MYKVGDRVIVHYDDERATYALWRTKGYRTNEAGAVVDVCGSDKHPFHIKLDTPRNGDNGLWWAGESELTPIAPEPRFKIGDRVMVNRSDAPLWGVLYGGPQPARILGVLNEENIYHIQVDNKHANDDGLWIAMEKNLTLIPSIPAGWTPADEPPDSDRNVRVLLKDGREWFGWFEIAWNVFYKSANIERIKANRCYEFEDAAPGEVIGWREIDSKPTTGVKCTIDWSWPAPAPARLKVGQRVRAVTNTVWFKAGERGTLVDDDGGGCPFYVKFDEQDSWWCYESDLEPLPEPAPKESPRYAVAADLPTTITVWHDTYEAAVAEAGRLAQKTGKVFRVLKVVAKQTPGEPTLEEME